MKAQSEQPDISEMPPYRLGRHWNTIQAYLIPGIEDDIGELNEELRKFMEKGLARRLHGQGARAREGVPPPDVRHPRHRGAEADRHRTVYLLTVPVLRAASASARRRFSSSMNFMSISLSHSGKRLRWIVCQWRPSLYLPPFSLLSSMFSPRQSAPCANWNISAS